MDDFARRQASDQRVYFEEAANRRDLTPIIIEKDFWVCWTLRRLMHYPPLAGQLTFKGGTSLSKAYGLIARFSEDIDLTIRRDAPVLSQTLSPMEDKISGNERQRRTKTLVLAAQTYVATIAKPRLEEAITDALGSRDGWTLELDPDDRLGQTLLFHYPRTSGSGNDHAAASGSEADSGYVKPRIKLEYGARGDPEPYETCPITPYLTDEFPGELPDAITEVETLSVERTFWEKATILHQLYHNRKIRGGLSRHYYDLTMLARAGIDDRALDRPDLLEQVVHNKRLMFTETAASYETATLRTLRLVPGEVDRQALESDYKAMADMFMNEPPRFTELIAALTHLEEKLHGSTSTPN